MDQDDVSVEYNAEQNCIVASTMVQVSRVRVRTIVTKDLAMRSLKISIWPSVPEGCLWGQEGSYRDEKTIDMLKAKVAEYEKQMK
jgi:hypothetical protein